MNSESSPFKNNAGGTSMPGGLRIAQEAAEWVARCDRGLSEAERREFSAWRQAHPRHEAEWMRLEQAWAKFDGLAQVLELDALADEVIVRAQARRRRQRRMGWWVATSLAAAAAAVAVAVFQPRSAPSAPFAGALSQNVHVIESTLQRQLLPDGSAAELNGASRIVVEYTASERRVRLAEGEAHFVVLPDPARPFYVTAGPVTVRAVGTAFNVRLDPERVEVLVTHGKVKLERAEPVPAEPAAAVAPAMVQGQRAFVSRVEPAATPVEVADIAKPEIEEALGWQSTRLVFNNTPLDEVVEGFNRYNRHKLKLGDARIGSRQLTGVFRADNLDGFVRLLRSSIDVKAEQRTLTETVLLPVQ